MKRYVFLFILSLALILLLAGCELKPVSKDKDKNAKPSGEYLLNREMIKEKYTTEGLGEFVEASNFGDYVMIEYLVGGDNHFFDLYNLKTGDRDIMPLDCPNASLHSFGPNGVVFHSDGVSPGNGHRYFPYTIICTRVEEVTGREHDFYAERRELYKPIDEGVEFGVKSDEMVSDL